MLPSSRTNVPGERRSVPSFDAARESRGDILSQWEPANSVPAEGDLLTAIAVAGQTLPIDHPRRLRRARTAFKGFPPMRKFPEIEEVREISCDPGRPHICDIAIDNALSKGRNPPIEMSTLDFR
jgi:hypothetical protein